VKFDIAKLEAAFQGSRWKGQSAGHDWQARGMRKSLFSDTLSMASHTRSSA
jgi:hypothetical protein